MKERVLKTMVAAVDNTMRFSKSDFYRYDLKTLATADEKEPFLWCVRESATTLLMMSVDEEKERLNTNECCRFQFMQNPTVWIDNLVSVSQWSGSRLFYYNGNTLREIPTERVVSYAKDIFMPVIEELKEYIMANFAEQDGGYTRKVNIEFCDNAFAEVMQIARTDEGVELLKALKRFHGRARRSADHKIYIARDFMDKSFTFVEMAGKETTRLNGGIIYNGEHWTIHT